MWNRKKIETDLNFEDFLKFTHIQNCHYCNGNIKWTKYNLLKNSSRYNLDRKDNNKGYLKDNLVVCCWLCNNTKSNLYNYEEFLQLKPILTKIQQDRQNAGI